MRRRILPVTTVLLLLLTAAGVVTGLRAELRADLLGTGFVALLAIAGAFAAAGVALWRVSHAPLVAAGIFGVAAAAVGLAWAPDAGVQAFGVAVGLVGAALVVASLRDDLGARRAKVRRGLAFAVTALATVFALRAALEPVAEAGLNESLADLPEKWGEVDDLDIALYRGAYVIEGLRIFESGTDAIDLPVVACDRADISVDWDRLLDAQEIVAEVHLDRPQLNLVMAEKVQQTGGDASMRELLADLVPLTLNRLDARRGRVRYIDKREAPVVDVRLEPITLSARGLSTRPVESDEPLPGRIEMQAKLQGEADVELRADVDVHADPHPLADLTLEMSELPLPELNEFAEAYANMDFEDGTLSFYAELAISDDGRIEGYAKPLLTGANLDVTDGDPLSIAYEAFAQVAFELLENQSKNRLATRIPIEGRIDQADIDISSTIFSLLGNAFLEALLPSVDSTIDIDTVMKGKHAKMAQK